MERRGRMERMRPTEEVPERQGYLGLLGLILGLALGALALYTVAGPPHLPRELPGWDTAASTLRGSYLPLEAVAYVLTTAAWAVWLWIVASLALRVVVLGAEAVTGGAPWVAGLRAISNRVTLPIVRRLVDGALVAIIVVNLVGRSTPTVAAAVLTSAATATVVASHEGAPPRPAFDESRQDQKQRVVEYTVQAGDTLWAIAERFYGTGHEYARLLADNVGRQMPDGRRFTQAGVIHPGWVLLVHPASRAVEEISGKAFYTVRAGDTLRGIAARLLDDESRWPEIFDLNAGTARLEDGRVLKDPGLIWPGLWLQLPSSAPASDGEAPAPEPAAPTVEKESVSPEATIVVESPPTAIPPSPGGEVAVDEPAVALTPAVQVEPEPAPADSVVSPLVCGAAALATIATAGGAIVLARRRVRRSLSELPVRSVSEGGSPPSGDFAEAEFGRVLTHRLHGTEVEPVVLIAEQVLRFLDEQGVPEASVVTARQGRNATMLALSAGLLDQTRVLDLADELGARLGGTGQASFTPDHDVALQLSGLKLAGLIASPSHRPASPLRLLPMGVLPKGQTLYANWRELGHILVAGLPGGGTEVVLTSVVSALATRCRPEELRLWTVADRRLLPPQLLQLPHQCGALVDPADEAGVSRVLQQVRAELIRRMRESEREGSFGRASQSVEPDLVLAIGELGNLKDDGTTLELIGVHGPTHGVRLLATTTSPADLALDVLAHFGTRLVLQTLDDDESIRLLGHPDAADLGTGDLLLRIDGRVPVRALGFRVASDRLDELVRLMREAYGRESPTLEPMVAAAEEAEGGAHQAAEGENGAVAGQPAMSAEEPVAPSSELAAEAGKLGARQESGVAGELARPVQEASDEETALQSSVSVAGVAVGEDQSNGHHGQPASESIAPTDDARARVASPTEEGEEPSNGRHGEIVAWDTVVVAEEITDAEADTAEARSLVQIRCFGEFVVRSGEREITPSSEEGASFKAWEVLAFLAANPDGIISKERLLTAVWPNVDAERAGNRMRVAMVRLRALLARQVPGLPSETVRADRDGTCRLDTRIISSDVHQFVALCRTAPKLPPEDAKSALQQARALYGGDLLPGRGTRLYEWVDERDENGVSLRESYREEYYRATQRLARMFCREGRVDLAIPLYKSLLKA
ncbi:MAG: LysM peptidoglycan-binding domain-containing protein, partial [Candidatus Nanopelagicales bacterium]